MTIMFKLTDPTYKSSVNYKSSRYVLGGISETSPGFLQWWEKNFLASDPTDVIYTLEKKFEGRPDLLAYEFYDDDTLWWVICQYNTVLDFNSEFVEGLVLTIPTLDRITVAMSASRLGGVPSTATL